MKLAMLVGEKKSVMCAVRVSKVSFAAILIMCWGAWLCTAVLNLNVYIFGSNRN